MYVCVAENAELLVFFLLFLHLPHRQFSFRREVLNHHTPPPITKMSSITKTRILSVFLPKKSARLLPVLLQKSACLKDSAHCLFRLFFEPFHHTAIDSLFKIFHVRLGEISKSVGFSRVYVCVKAKLTLVSFFLLFFAPSPK